MPSGTHTVVLDIPIHSIWKFVSNMDRWAPLVPGYIEHQIISERKSSWRFKGETAKVKKTVNLQVNITKWQEPTKVTFDLKEKHKTVAGNGYFEAEALTDKKTKMTGHLNISAKGMMKPVINPVLKSFVPRNVEELTEAIAEKVMEAESALKVRAK